MRLAVFTSGRQDWNILEPVVRAISLHPEIEALPILGGLHHRHSPVRTEMAAVAVAEHVDSLQAADSALAVAQTAGWTTALLAGSLTRLRTDALLIAGDRTETLAAAVSATCLCLPIIHLHGGEETEGAVDNLCRHAISKLATIHFVAHAEFADRLVQLGEDPRKVFVCGAPSLDQIQVQLPHARESLRARFGEVPTGSPLIVFTYHPTTLGHVDPVDEIEIVLRALADFLGSHPSARVIATQANADEGGNRVNAALSHFAARCPQLQVTESLGDAYFGLLSIADLMLGNSSSGITESTSFRVPVVNIGDRQRGRLRGPNVLDAELDRLQIVAAISKAIEPGHRATFEHSTNPYGDGRAAPRIAEHLRDLAPELRVRNVRKPAFTHLAATPRRGAGS